MSAEAFFDLHRDIPRQGPGEGADPKLARILNDAEVEIAARRAYGDEFGYLLSVARPR